MWGSWGAGGAGGSEFPLIVESWAKNERESPAE